MGRILLANEPYIITYVRRCSYVRIYNQITNTWKSVGTDWRRKKGINRWEHQRYTLLVGITKIVKRKHNSESPAEVGGILDRTLDLYWRKRDI